jgi:hypothetical protein
MRLDISVERIIQNLPDSAQIRLAVRCPRDGAGCRRLAPAALPYGRDDGNRNENSDA